eukprot:Hpha_TRINITY_DN6674_c0_g1::TRINITY_DN6674_c0_g1_i1::g.26604::m.26604
MSVLVLLGCETKLGDPHRLQASVMNHTVPLHRHRHHFPIPERLRGAVTDGYHVLWSDWKDPGPRLCELTQQKLSPVPHHPAMCPVWRAGGNGLSEWEVLRQIGRHRNAQATGMHREDSASEEAEFDKHPPVLLHGQHLTPDAIIGPLLSVEPRHLHPHTRGKHCWHGRGRSRRWRFNPVHRRGGGAVRGGLVGGDYRVLGAPAGGAPGTLDLVGLIIPVVTNYGSNLPICQAPCRVTPRGEMDLVPHRQPPVAHRSGMGGWDTGGRDTGLDTIPQTTELLFGFLQSFESGEVLVHGDAAIFLHPHEVLRRGSPVRTFVGDSGRGPGPPRRNVGGGQPPMTEANVWGGYGNRLLELAPPCHDRTYPDAVWICAACDCCHHRTLPTAPLPHNLHSVPQLRRRRNFLHFLRPPP